MQPNLKLSLELLTIDRVDEGVVAGVAHCEPVEAEEHDVYVSPLVDGRVSGGGKEVSLPGRPAEREDHHHHQHHLQHFLLVPQDLVVTQLISLTCKQRLDMSLLSQYRGSRRPTAGVPSCSRPG